MLAVMSRSFAPIIPTCWFITLHVSSGELCELRELYAIGRVDATVEIAKVKGGEVVHYAQ